MREMSRRGAMMIMVVLGFTIVLGGMLAYNLLLRKHREHTVRQTIDTKSLVTAESLRDISRRQIPDGGGGSTLWSASNPHIDITVHGSSSQEAITYGTRDIGY